MINSIQTVKRIRMRTNIVTLIIFSVLLALLSFVTISSIVTVAAFRTTSIRTHRSRAINPLTILSSSSSSSSSSSRPDKKKMKTKKKTAADTFLLLEKLDEQIESYEGRLPSKMTAQKKIDENIDTENEMTTNTTITNVSNDDQQHRCGYAGIVGAPNMGKSTLLNSLLKEDLCIATRRPQTTRHAILGVLSSPTKQCCLLDTPGVLQGDGAYQLQANMMEAVKGALTDSDMIVVVTDLFSTPIPDDNVFRRLSETTKPVIVVVNKIDLEGRAKRPDETTIQSKKDDEEEEEEEFEKTYTVVEAVEKWRSLLPNALAIIPLMASVSNNDDSLKASNTTTDEHPGISLLRQILIGCDTNDEHDIPAMVRALGRPIPGMFRNGVKSLTNDDVKQLLPIGPPLYDDDFLSDRSVRFFCSELVREALLESRYLKKELPYCCEVQITDYKEPREDNITRIEATIFVERDGQKAIIIGKNGDVIKQVGIIAREKIERFLDGEKVFLQLRVKINKDWRKREDQLAKFGYSN
ncbi:MAG: small GTP-binding protein [Bacillariaceae sp.]|jgi:small GTP-binding protein